MAWTDVVLATDATLKKWESRMPELGKQAAGPDAAVPYDGKRALAKARITTAVRRRGMNPEGLVDAAADLGDVAAWLELSLIFRDMAKTDDSIYAEKAAHYLRLYTDEWDGIALSYQEPAATATDPDKRFGFISVSRG